MVITNLLTEDKKNITKKDMKVRFFVSISRSVFVVSIIACIMLLPAYILANSKVSEYKERLNFGSGALSEEDARILKIPEKIRERLAVYVSVQSKIDFNDIVNLVIGVKSENIKIESFKFQRNTKREGFEGAVISVGGKSTNRQSLVDFQKKLQSLPISKSVDLPVSSLTKDINLPFTLEILIKDDK